MKLSSKGQHRLFFALDFQDDIKQAIARWCATLAMNVRPALFRFKPETKRTVILSNFQVIDTVFND